MVKYAASFQTKKCMMYTAMDSINQELGKLEWIEVS